MTTGCVAQNVDHRRFGIGESKMLMGRSGRLRNLDVEGEREPRGHRELFEPLSISIII